MSKVILFQGDSITDWHRGRENDGDLGRGYSLLVASKLGFENPGQYTFLNRGISGNRIVDIYARIKKDIINLKPDYMSLLIGINDVWHEVAYQNGVSTPKFEKIYNMLLDEIFEALPDIKIMLLEPFVLPGSATVNSEEVPNRWELFDTGARANAQVVRKIAKERGLPFVELQNIFDELNAANPGIWLFDGVHPSVCGHQVIMREWIKTFESL